MSTLTANHRRKIRHARIRRKIFGTAERPRLSVFRSLKHLYIQAIDDTRGHTIAAVSTLSPEWKGSLPGSPKERAEAIGKAIAEKLFHLGITEAVFDRGGYKYHGRIRAIAEGARAAGLKF